MMIEPEDPHLHVVVIEEGETKAACSIWSNQQPAAVVMNSFGPKVPDVLQTSLMFEKLAESLNSNRKQ